jgi:RNA polymerase sigma-70 factor (ECF subfamily)
MQFDLASLPPGLSDRSPPSGLVASHVLGQGAKCIEAVVTRRVTTGVSAVSGAADEVDDGDLVERCRAGDGRAFDQLFERHQATVARIVYRMTGPGPDIEDRVQDVFLQVIRSLGGFKRQAKFSTWLYRITVNVVLMHRRAADRRPRLVDEDFGPPAVESARSGEDAVESRARIDAFYALLSRLSEKKRTVFVLHELEGLSPAAIAEVVGAPVLTVRTRLFYARREVVRMLDLEPRLSAVVAELSGSVEAAGSERKGAR